MNKRFSHRILAKLILLFGLLPLCACSNVGNPIDQAYYGAADHFTFAGGYTRTIFSTNNF